MNKKEESYSLLSLSTDATERDLKAAYRRLVRQWHPDRFAGEPHLQSIAGEKLKEIIEAYETVKFDIDERNGENPGVTAAENHEEPLLNKESQSSPIRNPFVTPYASSKVAPNLPLFTFFTKWQNLLFLAAVFQVGYITKIRFGSLLEGAIYALQFLAIPLILGALCHSLPLSKSRFIWAAYAFASALACILLTADVLTFGNTLQDSKGAEEYMLPAGGSAFIHSGPLPPLGGSEDLTQAARRRQGPFSPALPQVVTPSAPIAPAAPLMPVVPPAR